jgi:hypothetical protein
MVSHCKNCGHKLQGNYCSHCGQKAAAHRITFTYIGHEIIHFFSHMEHGFFYTSKELIVRPGKVVKHFIEGKRKNYQAPVSYFLIWVSIYFLLLLGVQEIAGENTIISISGYFGTDVTTHYALSHLSFILALLLPFHACYFYLLISRGTYNLAESFVAVTYSLGTIILLQSLFVIAALMVYLSGNGPLDLRLSDSLKVLYLIWFTTKMTGLFKIKGKLFRVVGFCILAFGTFTIWRLYGYPYLAGLFLEAE